MAEVKLAAKPNEEVWSEMESRGFFGDVLMQNLMTAPDATAFLLGLIAQIHDHNLVLAAWLQVEPAAFPLDIPVKHPINAATIEKAVAGDWSVVFETAATVQSLNQSLRQQAQNRMSENVG